MWLVMLGTAVDPSGGLLLALKQTYPNIHVVTVDLDWLFSDLPTKNLFSSGQWVDSSELLFTFFLEQDFFLLWIIFNLYKEKISCEVRPEIRNHRTVKGRFNTFNTGLGP